MLSGASIPSTITVALILILIALAFGVVVYGVILLISKLVMLGYKWLSQRAFFIHLRQKLQDWWDRHKISVTWLWESTVIAFIDPIFYGYVLVSLYQKVQAINEYTKTYTEYSFWQLLDWDTRTHMQYYIVLVVIFLIWMFAKLEKHRKDIFFQKGTNVRLDKLNENIQQNSEDIKHLIGSIEELAEEIRKGREAKNGKPPNDM